MKRLITRHITGLLATSAVLTLAACSGGQSGDLPDSKPVELGFHEVMVDPYLPEPASGKPPETTVDELKSAAVYEKVGVEVGKVANGLMAVPTDTETIKELAPFAELSAEEVALLRPKVRFFVPTINCAQLDGRDKSADPEDGELLVTCSAEDGGSDRQKYLLDEAALGSFDVESAKAEPDRIGDGHLVAITFTKVGAKAWKQLTADHVGKQLAIVIDGAVLAAPKIMEVVPGGTAQITGDFTRAEAEKLAAGIEAGTK